MNERADLDRSGTGHEAIFKMITHLGPALRNRSLRCQHQRCHAPATGLQRIAGAYRALCAACARVERLDAQIQEQRDTMAAWRSKRRRSI
jgi:hypothetical protein